MARVIQTHYFKGDRGQGMFKTIWATMWCFFNIHTRESRMRERWGLYLHMHLDKGSQLAFWLLFSGSCLQVYECFVCLSISAQVLTYCQQRTESTGTCGTLLTLGWELPCEGGELDLSPLIHDGPLIHGVISSPLGRFCTNISSLLLFPSYYNQSPRVDTALVPLHLVPWVLTCSLVYLRLVYFLGCGY